MKPPNILLLMTDQQRWDAMGCSGNWVETPNIDRIAQEGIRFTNCVTNAPVCIPTRLALAIGLYPHNTGIVFCSDHGEFAISELQGEIMILTQEWKLMINSAGQPYFLLDVRNDPLETENRVADPQTRPLQDALRLRVLEHLLRTQWTFGRKIPPYSVAVG